MSTVAFIGLGVMGRLMSANLAAGGYTVRSYDLNGSGSCKSPKEAADGAGILITMLPDGAAVRLRREMESAAARGNETSRYDRRPAAAA